MKKENIDFFVAKMKLEGFQVKRFPATPETRSFVGFQLFANNQYIESIVIDDDIKDTISDYHFFKFINACKTIALCKACKGGANNETIQQM